MQAGGRESSLESVLEEEVSRLGSLHPSGEEMTDELALRCRVREGSRVLDVACGAGATVIHLGTETGCRAIEVDDSPPLIQRAREMSGREGATVDLILAGAHHLPFREGAFDAVPSECSLCLMDKAVALREMSRVTRHNGYVGIHDLCWEEQADDTLRKRPQDVEGEVPETEGGWRARFEAAGLADIMIDRRDRLVRSWRKGIRERFGLLGRMRLSIRILREWGIRGLVRVKESEEILDSGQVSYYMVVGRKP